jgi:glutamate-5-semialdehyde dehydrogenase
LTQRPLESPQDNATSAQTRAHPNTPSPNSSAASAVSSVPAGGESAFPNSLPATPASANGSLNKANQLPYNPTVNANPQDYAELLGRSARRAAISLTTVDAAARTAAIARLARHLRENQKALLEANALDLQAAREAGLAPAMIERLRLDEKRIEKMAVGVEKISQQPDPLGQTLSTYVRPDGLRVERRRVAIGVVLFFYESRPNVTSDAAALCLRSGNAVILRGGKEAVHSNRAIADCVAKALEESNLDPASVQLVQSTDRALVPMLLKLDRYIDLVIPRGGESLIRAVVKESTIPVLKHFTGNCHVYVDKDVAGLDQKIRDICVNAKTGYPGGGVCNAAEKILFHRDVAKRLLPVICQDLASANVEIRGDEATRTLYPAAIPATAEDWPLEYLSLIIAIKVVDSLDQAIDHINEFGSHHTDAIVSNSQSAIDLFCRKVDSASVMVNASTRFADGGEYGLGAEIGISTDKLHARGPMGADDLTTYKWIVTGDGHVRR